MPSWIQLVVLIGVLVVVGAGMVIVVLARNARTARGPAIAGKYPQGHWMSVGMCIGIAMGSIPALVGLVLDDMSAWAGIGPAMGLGFGVAIGAALERNHKDELRPPTEQEQRTRLRLTLIALGALALLVLSLFVLGGIVLFTPR